MKQTVRHNVAFLFLSLLKLYLRDKVIYICRNIMIIGDLHISTFHVMFNHELKSCGDAQCLKHQ
jgi:hypothetical protein